MIANLSIMLLPNFHHFLKFLFSYVTLEKLFAFFKIFEKN